MACKTLSRKFKSNKNVTNRAVFRFEYLGESCKYDLQLIRNICQEQQIDCNLISILDDINAGCFNKEAPSLLFAFEIFQKLRNYHVDKQESNESKDLGTKIKEKFVDAYLIWLEVEFLLRFLMTSSLLPCQHDGLQESKQNLFLKYLAVNEIYQLCRSDPYLCRQLACRDDVLLYLFRVLVFKKAYIKTCGLIEAIIKERKEVLDLSTISNLSILIQTFEDHELKIFMSIITKALRNPKKSTCKCRRSLYTEYKHHKENKCPSTEDSNQDFLLNIPNFLSRLVSLCTIRPCTLQFPSPLDELNQMGIWVDRREIQASGDANVNDYMSSFIEAIATRHSCNNSIFRTPQGIEIAYKFYYKTEIFDVIGILLSGKHRKMILEKLVDFEMIPKLSELFDDCSWTVSRGHPFNEDHRSRGLCKCSETALKLQLLQLISILFNSNYNYLMLTSEEFEEVKNLHTTFSRNGICQEHHFNVKSQSKHCEGPIGLLSKIIKVMTTKTTHSLYIPYFTKAIEGLLQHTSCCAIQMFILKRGLLECMINTLLSNPVPYSDILHRSIFNLLGVLLKFNQEGFYKLSQIINDENKVNLFFSLMNTNLVHSSMFIQSMILSLQYFEHRKDDSENKLYFYKSFERQIDYLINVMQLITVQCLSVENINCLNTSLVILILAHKKSKMHLYLDAMKTKANQSEISDKNIMLNLRNMLIFWQEYYSQEERIGYRIALEMSSRIKFTFWLETVALLVHKDFTSSLSLLHYVDSGQSGVELV